MRQTATKEVIATVMAAAKAKIVSMAVGAFMVVSSICVADRRRPTWGRRRVEGTRATRLKRNRTIRNHLERRSFLECVRQINA